MIKFRYSLLIAAGFLAFNSCSNNRPQTPSDKPEPHSSVSASSYGTYLAGRIAHYRQDFDSAAEYYMQTAQKDPDNKALLNRAYLMLASQGRISEAARYAETALAKGDKNDFIPVIIAADKVKQNDYAGAIKIISRNNSQLYRKLITPFVSAWSYAGMKQPQQAIAALNTVKSEKGMAAMYNFHAGMIYDYFDQPNEARQYYETILGDSSMDLSVRMMEIIGNFYIRNGEKDKALALTEKYAAATPPVDILQQINQRTHAAQTNSTSPLITSAQVGLSEALFNIASIIRHNSEVLDFSHIFIRLAVYEDPHNNFARFLLGNILEMREMYKDAIAVYDEIPPSSPIYHTAQYKKAENLRNINDYKASELLLKSLILDSPNDYQVLLDLGDTLRLQEKYSEALKYYDKVLEQYQGLAGGRWQMHYAKGITYERMNKWNDAEKSFLQALKINPDNLLVQNYLGYSWLRQGKNPEEAFSHIVSAYNQAPYNSNIIDSLGWAFYRLGMYDKAVFYLEKAVDSDPSSAVVNDHLGDAYWQADRRNEAHFQWNHALSLKDDTGEVLPEVLKQKLSQGLTENQTLKFDTQKIEAAISKINDEINTTEK